MSAKRLSCAAWSVILFAAACPMFGQTEKLVKVELAYRAPGGNRPTPDFSPYGTQVKLADWPENLPLPEGASLPAKTGMLQVGPNAKSWIRILAATDSAHPQDLCRLYIDTNRNGSFTDDGPALTVKPNLNEKTKAVWSSFNDVEIPIPYDAGIVEPYLVNFWSVRDGDQVPGIMRYSVASWRSGTVSIDSVEALVAVMDANNDALFDGNDKWSILAASEPDAPKRVLSHKEARPSSRLMFLAKPGSAEAVLEFRGITPDGRSLTFAVVDRKIRKAEDRAPDDTLASERARPRTTHAFPWIDHDIDAGLAKAKASGRRVIVDFWATWCGPCKTLDEWIFSDSEVAAVLNESYVGVKLDADIEKAMVTRYRVEGYPTVLVLDSSGKEIKRFGYLPSKAMLGALKP